MAVCPRTRSSRTVPSESINQSLLQAEPPVPPVESVFHGERVPLPEREAEIALTAYWRAEKRGFAPGFELEDWIAAEKEVDAARAAQRKSEPGTSTEHS